MNIVHTLVQFEQMAPKGNNKVSIRCILKPVFWSMAIKKYSWKTTFEQLFFPVFSGSRHLEYCIYLWELQRKRDTGLLEQIQRKARKNQKAETSVLWQKAETLRFTLEKSRQASGRPYSSLTVYKGKFIRQRGRDFSPGSVATSRGTKDLNWKRATLNWMQGEKTITERMWQYTAL